MKSGNNLHSENDCSPVGNSSNTSNILNHPSEIIIRHQTKEIENHLPRNMCSGTPSLYNELIINNFARYKDGRTDQFIGLLCLNCATCLAVAELDLQATNRLISHFDKYNDEGVNMREFENNLENVCNTAFKNYDLRNYNGHLLVSQCTITTIHVKTPFDDQWTKKLRDTCKRFVSHMDLELIVFQRKWGNLTFADHLCSGDGIFRDCKSFRLYPSKIPKGRGFILKQLVDCNAIAGNSQC